LLGLFFDPEDGGDLFFFFRNIGWLRTTRRHIPENDFRTRTAEITVLIRDVAERLE
jgi:hypothetical protein